MRFASAVTSVSWIPSEAITGLLRVPFDAGVTHYDEPPPDTVADLAHLRTLAQGDRFRFANRLAAWVDVDGGTVVDAGYADDSAGVMGGSTVRVGPWSVRAAAVEFPVLRRPVQVTGESATFVQTVGGRAGLPAPRKVDRSPFVQLRAPLVWTTLALELRADGRSGHEVRGASRFPRHWVYDADGVVVAKTGLTDFDAWYRASHGRRTPWGGEDEAVLVTAAEQAVEREVSRHLMRSADVTVRTLPEGAVLTRQGDADTTLFLLLDGVVLVQVDGRDVVELGPGIVVGERALLETGVRTATLVARTPIRVAAVPADAVDRASLQRISQGHHREDTDLS